LGNRCVVVRLEILREMLQQPAITLMAVLFICVVCSMVQVWLTQTWFTPKHDHLLQLLSGAEHHAEPKDLSVLDLRAIQQLAEKAIADRSKHLPQS